MKSAKKKDVDDVSFLYCGPDTFVISGSDIE